ncbi:TonB-dependent receptor [Tenacibaculum sp. S7007]|uniref:TonB-dependent receptor n=1 Tax=Tenacibaculum pelagium TaxID=2759527 RepID=A0A839AMB9_9FLAO|nr:TonB-dependent receptor [Tenacibaculum pelagium]MBA6154921.1 TonB-dependent receptor [Tenacibaculum pelagium]
MKKQLLIVGAIAMSFASTKITAQEQEKNEELDEVVVTATKTKMSKKNIGKVVYKLTSKEIEERQGKTLTEILNEIPGIEINGSQSNRGQNNEVYIRGGRSHQAAILIDGVNVNNGSTISNNFDLRQLDLNQIESIEVLKGASSVLYGSGAATGVINIRLKKASRKEFSGTFTTSLGSNRSAEGTKFSGDELQANFNFNGTVGQVDYLIGLNSNSSSGLSAIESSNINSPNKEDKFYRQNALLRVGYKVDNNLKFGVQGSFNKFFYEYDDSFSVADADDFFDGQQKRALFFTDFKYNKGKLRVDAFYTKIDGAFDTAYGVYQSEGKEYGFDVFNNYKVLDQFSFIVGLAAQYQDMESGGIKFGSVSQHSYDPYVSVNYNSDFGLNVNAGVRANIHNEYGTNLIYNVNPSYNFEVLEDKNLKLFASYSTAFIAPSLYQIFNKRADVEILDPESNYTIEGGLEFEVLDNLNINTVYFYREETDKVAYDNTTFKYFTNNGTFNSKGFETQVNYSPLNKLNLSFDYVYTNYAGLLETLKLPKHKFGGRVNYHVLPTTYISANYRFTGEREGGSSALESYGLLDFFVNHKVLKDKITLFGNVTNLLNENYQEIPNYTTRGRNYNLGLKVQF